MVPAHFRLRRALPAHRSGDTTISLISAVLGIPALLAAVVGLLAHQLDTAWQPMIIAAAAAHQLLWAPRLR